MHVCMCGERSVRAHMRACVERGVCVCVWAGGGGGEQ